MRAHRLSPDAVHAFTHVATVDAERARIVVVPVLTPGVVGMTLGRWILLRRGHEGDAGLVAHELVHVQQWREHGAFGFLLRYLADYLRARAQGRPHWTAYESIAFESEARSLSGT